MHRVGKDAEAHEQAAQAGKAHKSAAKRGGKIEEGHRSIKVRRGSSPSHSSLTSYRFQATTTAQSHRLRVER
jgi:hypothetical protein